MKTKTEFVAFWKSLSIHQRINFRNEFQHFIVRNYRMLEEVYYGPMYYGSSPFRSSWDNSGCVNSL